MQRGIESLDVSREASNFDKLDIVFEKRPHGAGSFKCIESGIVYFVLWTFSAGVYSFRFITQNGEKISAGVPTDTFGSLIASLKDFPIGTVSPSKTIQEVLDENGRSVIIQDTLGTYLALLFPNDSTHTTLRFYQTIYGTSSKITGPVLNSESLITAYNASIAESYDTSFEDISSLFANYQASLSSLGFTEISWVHAPIMRRQGPQRCITGLLKFKNQTASNIGIPSSTVIAMLPNNDLPDNKIGWMASDTASALNVVFNQSISENGRLNNDVDLTCTPGTYFMTFNFDYSI